MNIIVILLIFNAGFLVGAMWDSVLKEKVILVLFLAFMILWWVHMTVKSLWILVSNPFRRTKQKVYWDPMDKRQYDFQHGSTS